MKQADDSDSISDYNGIYQASVASLQQASSTKNSTRIQDDFYFSGFHPIDDYSLEVYIVNLFEGKRKKELNISVLNISNIPKSYTHYYLTIFV